MVGGHNSDMLLRPAHLLRKGDSRMAPRIERTEGHSETWETSHGDAYVCDARSCLVSECVGRKPSADPLRSRLPSVVPSTLP
jgi:hypothetical protein